MGKNKKGGIPKKNAYSIYVAEQARITGMSMQEAFCACAGTWENMPDYEKKVYKDRENAMRGGATASAAELSFYSVGSNTTAAAGGAGARRRQLFDSTGRSIIELERKEQEELEFNSEMRQWIRSALFRDNLASPAQMQGPVTSLFNTYKVFVVGHLNIHCKTAMDEMVPAELALVKFSLAEGIKDTYSKILSLQDCPIPDGYNGPAMRNAEKTHNIPYVTKQDIKMGDDEAGLIGERSTHAVKIEINRFLRGEPVFVLFDLDEERENWRNLFEKVLPFEMGEEPKVFDISTLLFDLEAMLMEAAMPQLPGPAKSHLRDIKDRSVTSRSTALAHFEEDTFLYRTPISDSCQFHRAVDNVRYCSLSVAKRRVFSLCDISAVKLNIGLRPGFHLPASAITATKPDDEASEDTSGGPQRPPHQTTGVKKTVNYQSMAVTKQFVNAYGVEVPKCGPKGGQAFIDQERDPAPFIRQKKKENEREIRREMSRLALAPGEVDEIPGLETVRPSELITGQENINLDEEDNGDLEPRGRHGRRGQYAASSVLNSSMESASVVSTATTLNRHGGHAFIDDAQSVASSVAVARGEGGERGGFIDDTQSVASWASVARDKGTESGGRRGEETKVDDTASVVSAATTCGTTSTRKYRLLAKFRNRE